MGIITQALTQTKGSNSRSSSVRIEGRDTQGYANQRRHDLRIGPQPKYVDKDRIDLNRTLITPPTPGEMKAEAKRRRSQRKMTRAIKKNAGVAVIGIITFGHESQQWFLDLAPEVQDQAMRKLVDRIAEEMNTTTTGLVLHFYETAPHAHFSTDGYDLDGDPISNILKKGLFYRLQDIAHQELQAFIPTLERGHSRKLRITSGDKLSDTLHRSVQQLHADLPVEIAQKKLELDAMVLKLEKNTALAAKAAEKAAGDDERAEKARKL